jgi:hypothetical protein
VDAWIRTGPADPDRPQRRLAQAAPRLVARAWHYAAEYGFAAAAIDAPGHGDRPRSTADEQFGTDLRRAMEAGEPVDFVDAFIVPLVEGAVPQWRTTLDALLSLPEIGGPVGYEGMTAIGIRPALVEPRISAAVFFGQGFVPGTLREAARQVTIPLQFLLSGTTKGWNGSRSWTCSTPSAPGRRRCTPIWAGTPVPRGSRWTTRPGSSPGT